MFKNKNVNIIFSLIIAICLWAYVVGEIDPAVTTTFKGVPIKTINEDVLRENNLSLVSLSSDTVDITLTGKRSVISRIEISDITANVDLSEAVKGDNELKIDIKIPEKTELDNKSLNMVTVTVEDRISAVKPVEVEYTGSFTGDSEPITENVSLENVTVYGAKSKVDAVDHVNAVVASSQVKDESIEVESKLVAVDEKENEVDNLEMSASSVSITTVLANVKTVSLNVPIVDSESDDLVRTTSAPETIVVKGKKSDLESIDSITARAIDISSITESTEIRIDPVLPDGIEISTKNDSLMLSVSVTKYETKKFTFGKDDISVRGLSDDLTASINTESVDITVTGTSEQLAQISASDFALQVDLTDLEKGNHNVDLAYSCNKEYMDIVASVKKIKISIE